MTANGWLQIAFFSLAVLAIARPLGVYIVRVYDGSMGWLRLVERLDHRSRSLPREPRPPTAGASPTSPTSFHE